MAKKVSENEILNMSQDWAYDMSNGLPYSGAAVQNFIKKTFGTKMGYFHYDTASNRYLVFADEESKNQYVENPNMTELVLGTFDAPFNYEASITMLTPLYNAVFIGSTGNYLDFTFDIKNKQGNSTGENVTVSYTFIRNANKKTITETRRYGETVHFNIDDHLLEGTNTIIVGVVGQNTFAATTSSVTYQVVNLVYSDEFNISKVYNLSQGSETLEVFFNVSGYSTKIVEWFIDGKQLDFVKFEDEIVDISSQRTKYIEISSLDSGIHTLQSRAYVLVNGEKFYTNTLYREFIVNNGDTADTFVALSVNVPNTYGIITEENPLICYGAEQYLSYDICFATNKNATVVVKLNNEELSSLSSIVGVENNYSITSNTAGTLNLSFVINGVERTIPFIVNPTSLNIEEIKSGLVFDFNAKGRSNSSINKDEWYYENYIGTLTGFNWNNLSGWVNNSLLINTNAEFKVDCAPLAEDVTTTGGTFEFEFSTNNVEDDNAVICDLRTNGVGILITASEASITSAAGVTLSCKYKAGENHRISFVINRKSGVTYKGLAFVYVDGIISGAVNYGTADNFISNKTILFEGTDDAQIALKAMRFYNRVLSSSNMINNYVLYRNTLAEMFEAYYRNQIYEEGSEKFSPENLAHYIPVMIITGDIPVLESATDTSVQILVDIEFINEQDPTKSFLMKNVVLKIQGTSSLAYPRKNFRIYTRKEESSVVYDYLGNIILDKLYAFKDGAQPVDCWNLKADYAESSGTHNTGIARLWNKVMYGAIIQHTNVLGETVNGYALRTQAQIAALSEGYPYDVRTTVDGFPIVLFYRQNVNDDLIFLGKYNFNNDKSTPSVFGFEGIPGFDNSRMQCWETKDNGHPLGLFTDISEFDEKWSEAFESRYPDTKTPNTDDLKTFSIWINGVSQENFITQKWEHFDVYKVAAYYVYLMRFGAVDQPVKNAFITSEDGNKFYFINYDNDTINGLINTGRLILDPTIDRDTIGSDGEYVYAGHNSVLWNKLTADTEFMEIVKIVDNALYSAGLRYEEIIKIFNEEQAAKWAESIYNQDAEYKYLLPYVNQGTNNLFMLQGSRTSHRSWWLRKRFDLYDSLYVSGSYRNKNISFKCLNDTSAGQEFSITAGTNMSYGYGINNGIREVEINLDKGESHSFITTDTLNLGDVVKIFAAANIETINLSKLADRLAVLDVTAVADELLGNKLKKLILGGQGKINTELESISGIKVLNKLQELNIEDYKNLTTLDLTAQTDFRKLYAKRSMLSSIDFAKGSPVNMLELPNSLLALTFNQLTNLSVDNIKFETNMSNIHTLNITGCPNLSNNYAFIKNWLNEKTIEDSGCTLIMDNIKWNNITPFDFSILCIAKLNGMIIDLKGKVKLTESSQEIIDEITNAFGSSVFNPTNSFYVSAPDAIYLAGPAEINEGENAQFTAAVFSDYYGTVTYSIYSGSRTGTSINDITGYLTTTETGTTSTLTIRAIHKPTKGSTIFVDKQIKIKQRIYPDPIIEGNKKLNNNLETYTWSTNTSNVNGNYYVDWELSGDITQYGIIESYNNQRCIIKKLNEPLEEVAGKLTIKIIKKVDNTVAKTASIDLLMFNSDILITKTSNASLLECFYNNGLCANENYMTKEEASYITEVDIQPTTSSNTSIFFNKYIGNFEEFEYFTALTKIPAYCFYRTTCYSIKLPPNITVIESNGFNSTYSLQNLILNEGLLEIQGSAISENVQISEIRIPSTVTTIGSYAIKSRTIEKIYGANGVTNINKYAFSSYQISYIENTSTFGIFYFADTYNYLSINYAVIAWLYGIYTFSTKSGAYFDDMTTSRALKLEWTGKAEDLSNRLKIGYVTLNITSNKPEAEFKINYTNSFTDEIEETIVGVGSNILPIKPNTSITIDGYTEYYAEKFKTVTVTISAATTNVTCNYEELVDIYIAHKDGTLYTSEEWTASGNSSDDAEGVCVMRAKSGGFIIAKTNASDSKLAWGGYDKLISGIGSSTTSSIVVLDMDGVGNTPKIIEQCEGYTNQSVTGAPAAEACASYAFPSGQTGYLPALGELDLAYDHKAAIVSTMTLIGGTAMKSDFHWSSTQYGNGYSWPLSWADGKWTYKSKADEYYVRAFAPIGRLTINSTLPTKFTLSYTNNYGNVVTEKVNQGSHNLNVKNGTQVTVTPDAIGNMTAEPQTFTWQGFTHECNFVFAKDAGVYIQHVNGSLYTEYEWTAGGYANSDANGVAILIETAPAFVIAKQDASSSKLKWGGYGKEVPDIVTSKSYETAVLDYDGAGNTPKIIEYLAGINDSAPAAEACASYTFPSGAKGYLPALGEWKAAYDNKDAVVSAMSLIGGTEIKSDYYQSSTQSYSGENWSQHWGNGKLFSSGKGHDYSVRAFSAL